MQIGVAITDHSRIVAKLETGPATDTDGPDQVRMARKPPGICGTQVDRFF